MKYCVFEELSIKFLGYVFADSASAALKAAYNKFPQYISLTIREAA